MRVIAFRSLREHWQKPGRSDSERPLRAWHAEVERADWDGPAALKAAYRSASFVGDRIVFNVAGNKYRLVVWVNYPFRTVYVRFVGTHAEYDQIDVETI